MGDYKFKVQPARIGYAQSVAGGNSKLKVFLTFILLFQLIAGMFLFMPKLQEVKANGTSWYNSSWLNWPSKTSGHTTNQSSNFRNSKATYYFNYPAYPYITNRAGEYARAVKTKQNKGRPPWNWAQDFWRAAFVLFCTDCEKIRVC